MNKIIVNQGSFKLEEIELTHGTITIGRAADNDIRLDDSAVSSHHAKVVTLFDVSFIQDMESTNGTLVNGKAIKKHTLHAGDVVSLGKHQLLFQSAAAGQAGSNETIIINRQDMQNMLSDYMDNKPPAPAPFKPIQAPGASVVQLRPVSNQPSSAQALNARTSLSEDVMTMEKQSRTDNAKPQSPSEKKPALELNPPPSQPSFIPKTTQKLFDGIQTQQFQDGDLIRNPVPAVKPVPQVTRVKTTVVDPSADLPSGRNGTLQPSAKRQTVSDATLLKMIIQKDGAYSRKGQNVFGSLQTVLGFLIVAIIVAISFFALK